MFVPISKGRCFCLLCDDQCITSDSKGRKETFYLHKDMRQIFIFSFKTQFNNNFHIFLSIWNYLSILIKVRFNPNIIFRAWKNIWNGLNVFFCNWRLLLIVLMSDLYFYMEENNSLMMTIHYTREKHFRSRKIPLEQYMSTIF